MIGTSDKNNLSKHIVIGCVAENSPKYLEQALRLILSVRWFGGKLSQAPIIVCAVEDIDQRYKAIFEKLGAMIRTVSRFSEKHGPSNKLRFFEVEDIDQYESIVFLDCDTLVLGDFSSRLTVGGLQAKIADMLTVPLPAFMNVLPLFDIDPKKVELEHRCTYSGEASYVYCNTGVLFFSKDTWKRFYPVWRKANDTLLDNLEFIKGYEYYCDQISFSVAYYLLNGVSFEPLSSEFNFPMHLDITKAPQEMLSVDPFIVHYHQCTDESGYILKRATEPINEKIARFNERYRTFKREHFDNRMFWNFRYSQFPDLGSGLGSRGENLIYKRQILNTVLGQYEFDSLLDIGCGDQMVTEHIRDDCYTGVDISSEVIRKNQLKYPRRKYYCGDFIELDLGEHDISVCFDVLIHLPAVEQYRQAVKKIVDCTNRIGIVSGFEHAPQMHKSEITFFHEPLSVTLQNLGITDLQVIGEYRETKVLLFKKGSHEVPSDKSDELRRPVFVVGCMRSGTTILADLLGEHPEIVHCPFELRHIWSGSGGIPMASPKTKDRTCEHLTGEHLQDVSVDPLKRSLYAEYIDKKTDKSEHARFLNKNPHLSNKVELAHAIFPDAQFIWIYRDLYRVTASLKRLFEYGLQVKQTWHYWPEKSDSNTVRCWHCYFDESELDTLDKERLFPGGNIRYLAEYWYETNRYLWEFTRKLGPGKVLPIREEDLIANPKLQLAKITGFLGIRLRTEYSVVMDASRNADWVKHLSKSELETLVDFVSEYREKLNFIFGENYNYEWYLKRLHEAIGMK